MLRKYRFKQDRFLEFEFDEDLVFNYTKRDCWFLADALSRFHQLPTMYFGAETVTPKDGYSLMTFTTLHAFNVLPDGRLVDIRGLFDSIEHLGKNFAGQSAFVRHSVAQKQEIDISVVSYFGDRAVSPKIDFSSVDRDRVRELMSKQKLGRGIGDYTFYPNPFTQQPKAPEYDAKWAADAVVNLLDQHEINRIW